MDPVGKAIHGQPTGVRSSRRPALAVGFRSLLATMALCGVIAATAAAGGVTGDPADTRGQARERPAIVLERIEVTGNTRTAEGVVVAELGLVTGQPVDQVALWDAIGALRRSGLFAQVDAFTRPGSAPGRLVLVLQVVERRPSLRFGTGNSDLDGWYLIPVELDLDGALGRGERSRLQLRIGYRHAGLLASYTEGGRGTRRGLWGVELGAVSTDRIYFLQGVEVAHRVDRGWLTLHAGRRLGRAWGLRLSLRRETVDPAPAARVYRDDTALGVHADDPVPAADLPPAIAGATDRRRRTITGVELRLDTRHLSRVADTPTGGAWGRLRGRRFAQDEGPDFGAADLDLRLYRRLPGGVLAWRGRAAVVGNAAPFYDRLYLGGLYTVRGVPSQSLSRPEGDTWLWQANLEFRAPLAGDPARPRLAGSLFLDAGRSGLIGRAPDRGVRLGAGWGLRYRLGRFATVGLDVGLPLGAAGGNDAFRAHAALEWGF